MTNHEACSRGWQQLNAGRKEEARGLFEQVLANDANYAAALHGAGWVAYLQGRRRNAAELLARALRSDPKRAEAHLHLAMVQREDAQLNAAIESMRRAIKLNEGNGDYHAVLAAMLQEKGQTPQSVEAYRRAVALNPADVAAWVNLAHGLLELHRLEEAEAAARSAVAADPMLSTAHLSLGLVLSRQNRASEAEEELERALNLHPGESDAHILLGFSLLRRAEFSRGWREYEWRFRGTADPVPRVQCKTPQWDGSSLEGKTLLIHAEQGYGDAIQFARFLPQLATRGCVIFRCAAELVDLMRTLPGGINVFNQNDPMPDHDVHLPLLSLGSVLPIDFETIDAAPIPYLVADPARVAEWSAKLPPAPGTQRIGISWAGNPRHVDDQRRSIDPRLLTPLSHVPGVTWISLQKPPRGTPAIPLIDFTPQLKDFADTAALIHLLDLVISVDTAVAHLAGALGRPVWTLVTFQAEWRWLHDRTDSPWYPTMRLFRQSKSGDWDSVIAEVARELGALA